jgi:hypothetical protein
MFPQTVTFKHPCVYLFIYFGIFPCSSEMVFVTSDPSQVPTLSTHPLPSLLPTYFDLSVWDWTFRLITTTCSVRIGDLKMSLQIKHMDFSAWASNFKHLF